MVARSSAALRLAQSVVNDSSVTLTWKSALVLIELVYRFVIKILGAFSYCPTQSLTIIRCERAV